MLLQMCRFTFRGFTVIVPGVGFSFRALGFRASGLLVSGRLAREG